MPDKLNISLKKIRAEGFIRKTKILHKQWVKKYSCRLKILSLPLPFSNGASLIIKVFFFGSIDGCSVQAEITKLEKL